MTPGAERKKRLRARQRNGEVVAPVTVNNTMIEMLIDLAWLEEAESEDRKQIGRAIAEMLNEFAFHRPRFSGTRGQPTNDECGLIGSTNSDRKDHR